jgi:hypothetical protein
MSKSYHILSLSKTCFKNSKVSYQSKPPGSGVPVLGIIEGSSASKSNVMNTFSVIWSMAESIQLSSSSHLVRKIGFLLVHHCFFNSIHRAYTYLNEIGILAGLIDCASMVVFCSPHNLRANLHAHQCAAQLNLQTSH